jgi:tRNA A37 threonylcarbamoyladenosine synthetase subunit TsaC/SUA5/YrdC
MGARDVEAGGGIPSSVLDLTRSEPRMLREGAISSAEIAAVLEKVGFE